MRSSVLITTHSIRSIIMTPKRTKRSTVRQLFSKLMKNLFHSNHSRTKMDSLAGSYSSSSHLAVTRIRLSIRIMGHRSASCKSPLYAARTTCTGCRRSRGIWSRRWNSTISRMRVDCPRPRPSRSWSSNSSKLVACKTSWEASSTSRRRNSHRVLLQIWWARRHSCVSTKNFNNQWQPNPC